MRASPPSGRVRSFPAFTVRVHPELREQLLASAQRNRRSMSAEIEVLLEAGLKAMETEK